MKRPIPFGKYYLLDRINAGGMAEVFRAKAFGVEGFERIVAVKRILPAIAEDTDFITMFIDEAKIAVQLNHANIAQIFDLGKVGDAYFIALEYVHGKDLRALFEFVQAREEPLPVDLVCYVVMKVCEGLDYAHNKRDSAGRELELVHRDVSPQNVLLSYDGEVKLIDFGIARAAGKAGKTRAGVLKGKFGYLSPEQVHGQPIDRRSDVFGVGIVLYELLTGERLFAGDSDFSSIEKVRTTEVPSPRRRNSKISKELEDLILSALARDPAHRIQTAMELHDALQKVLYARGESFGRRDLSAWMHAHFAKEAAGDQEAVGDLQGVEPISSETTDVALNLEPAEFKAVNRDIPDGPESGKPNLHKSTILGMPAVAAPGRSVPPPPPRGGAGGSIAPPRSAPPGPPGQGRSAPPPPPRSVPPGNTQASRTIPPPPEPPRSVPPGMREAPVYPPAEVAEVPRSVPPGTREVPRSVPPGTREVPRSVPPGMREAPRSVAPSTRGTLPPGGNGAGLAAAFGGRGSGTIPSMTTARTPSSPPPGASRSVPPPPGGGGYPSTLPGPVASSALAAAPQASPVLDMDWDDEELSTQIYDRPDDLNGQGGDPYESVESGYEDLAARGTPQQHPSAVATYVPPPNGAGIPGVQVSPKAFTNSDAPPQQLTTPPVGSRAAQVTQPIVTQTAAGERNRNPLFAALAVAAVVVLCFIAYVFLAKTEPGVVQLTTHPADAEVLFDGKTVGSASPFVVTGVAPGETHLLEVRKDGYRAWSQEVQVQPGQTLQFPVSLQPSSGSDDVAAPGAFSLETAPPGALVFLDGQQLKGVTPLRVANLIARRYDVRVRLTGYREQQLAVDVRAGVDQSLPRVALVPESVRVRVSSDPPKADATIVRGSERRPLGKTPLDVDLDTSGEPWTLEIEKSGFETYSERLSVEGGQSEVSVRATLVRSERAEMDTGGGSVFPPPPVVRKAPREPSAPPPPKPSGGGSGTLRINARPWAQVFVDGKLVGNTPQMNLSLSEGSHRVTLLNPEFNLRKNITVNIKAGEATTQIVNLQQ